MPSSKARSNFDMRAACRYLVKGFRLYLARAGDRCHTLGVWASQRLRSDPWLQQQGFSAQTTTNTSQQAIRLGSAERVHTTLQGRCQPGTWQIAAVSTLGWLERSLQLSCFMAIHKHLTIAGLLLIRPAALCCHVERAEGLRCHRHQQVTSAHVLAVLCCANLVEGIRLLCC
jgi:hypothetical protein